MEAIKKLGSSSSSSPKSSSLISDGSGSKDLSAPSSKVVERVSVRPKEVERKKEITQIWNAKLGTPENILWSADAKNQYLPNQDNISFYEEEKRPPCNLSSSIYYGGQDMYIEPTKKSGNDMYYIDVGEDDTGSAARGNWWKGGLYY